MTAQKGQSPVRWTVAIWVLLSVLLFAVMIFSLDGGSDQRTRISYTDFRTQLADGNVRKIQVQGQRIRGEFQQPLTKNTPGEQARSFQSFVTYLPSFGDENLLMQLQSQGVEVETEPEQDYSSWMVLLNIVPFVLLIALIFAFLRSAQTQRQDIFRIGRSRAKMYEDNAERTSFDDVAGAEGAKTELREVIEYLKDPARFQLLGGNIPRGVLLVGPPGTGKTLLARAVAGEAVVPFLSITGSDFMEMLVGVGASRVRDLFTRAKRGAPSIIFIDELDSIGRRRGAGLGGGHDEREQTLNQLLSEMDGFERHHSVIVMAATNRPDILDPALLRPGRFDRHITVALPTMKERLEILKIHTRNKPLADGVDLEKLARGTPGFSGADLENLINEAALLAARRSKHLVEDQDVEEARDRIILGLAREGLILTDREKRLLSYHESGHALLAALLPHSDPIHKVTIVPRGRSMGVTQQLPERDKYIYPRDYLLDRLAVVMGGRAAEELVFETITSGAEDDLKQATQLARKMVLDWGMSKRFGNMALGGDKSEVFLGEEIAQQRPYSERTAREVDEEVKAILDESYSRAIEILRRDRHRLDRLAQRLQEEEQLAGEQVLKILEVDQKQPAETADT